MGSVTDEAEEWGFGKHSRSCAYLEIKKKKKKRNSWDNSDRKALIWGNTIPSSL